MYVCVCVWIETFVMTTKAQTGPFKNGNEVLLTGTVVKSTIEISSTENLASPSSRANQRLAANLVQMSIHSDSGMEQEPGEEQKKKNKKKQEQDQAFDNCVTQVEIITGNSLRSQDYHAHTDMSANNNNNDNNNNDNNNNDNNNNDNNNNDNNNDVLKQEEEMTIEIEDDEKINETWNKKEEDSRQERQRQDGLQAGISEGYSNPMHANCVQRLKIYVVFVCLCDDIWNVSRQ
ncbi:hypothetical protein RFI_07593 [Reticulomyxa filosa]|uniref:Uncharacterized protein n=1 Tax=Reticulomyxa filosa TaxID=46433 RepID=X6NU47_RETFI|nr:hypothetical protein RFI_07593 [Reticulomyxa filosa]|eukprot:ETO29526.1 hypothetical protein RFI_07593 [Reticulomyxa filosa]